MKNWLTIGIGVKRWIVALVIGSALFGVGFVGILAWLLALNSQSLAMILESLVPLWVVWLIFVVIGIVVGTISVINLIRVFLSPFSELDSDLAVELLNHRKKEVGPKIVAIGGGTGLSNLLRGLVRYTSNITAIVTVGDDGGSSGRLRRDYGMLPPGDFRNNIAALSRDETLMTQLLQYRFGGAGEGLSGHAFGNLLITALVGLTGSFEDALLATKRVLSIRGQVLPSTLTPITLTADVQVDSKLKKVIGESAISDENGIIRKIEIEPANVRAYPAAIRAILAADLVILGPGSLFTSIIPNLLIQDISRAIESTVGKVVYVCNVSSQAGETDNYSVSDHVSRLSEYISTTEIDIVIANNRMIDLPEESQSQPVRLDHVQGITVKEADLIDEEKPWRHDCHKLATILLSILE